MIEYPRKLSIRYISLEEVYSLSTEDAFEILSEEKINLSRSDLWTEENVMFLLEIVENKYLGVKNSYLEILLGKIVDAEEFRITGENDKLIECQCCGYNTIESFADYDICPVCFWEDDGTTTDAKYSSANKMTLKLAKRNFLRFGASSERRKEFIDAEGKMKYEKGR